MLAEDLGLETEKELGEGGQGLVLLCRQVVSGRRFACKSIASHRTRLMNQKLQVNLNGVASVSRKRKNKCNIKARAKTWTHEYIHHAAAGGRQLIMSSQEVAQNTQLRWEAEVLERLRGLPGILPLSAKVDSDDGCIHILTPFCDGGDLQGRLADDSALPEREAAYVVASLARALLSCHSQGIVHRDLKPANVLFRSRPPMNISSSTTTPGQKLSTTTSNQLKPILSSYQVFLADFGHAACIEPGQRGQQLHDPNIGTLPFHAPEVIRKRYDHRADIWSLGLLLHLMLTSQLPSFLHRLPEDASDAAIRRAILGFKDQQLVLNGTLVSPSAQSLLRRMLCKDPTHRITLQEVLKHPWVTGINKLDSTTAGTVVVLPKPARAAIDAAAAIRAPAAPAPRYSINKPAAPNGTAAYRTEASDSCKITTAMDFNELRSSSSKLKPCTKKRMPEEQLECISEDEEEEAFPRFTRVKRQVKKAAVADGFSCFQQHDVWRAVATSTPTHQMHSGICH